MAMQMVTLNPFTEMLSLQKEMDRMFNLLGASPARTGTVSSWIPDIDVKTTDDEMVVYAEVPGMTEKDIDIEVSNGMLTLSGERRSESEKDEEGWVIKERSYGSFRRTLALPEGVKEEDISADYANGMLEVHVPMSMKELQPQARHISIRSGNGEHKAIPQTEMPNSEMKQESMQQSEPTSQEKKEEGPSPY